MVLLDAESVFLVLTEETVGNSNTESKRAYWLLLAVKKSPRGGCKMVQEKKNAEDIFLNERQGGICISPPLACLNNGCWFARGVDHCGYLLAFNTGGVLAHYLGVFTFAILEAFCVSFVS